jgi:hypothetical protein
MRIPSKPSPDDFPAGSLQNDYLTVKGLLLKRMRLQLPSTLRPGLMK